MAAMAGKKKPPKPPKPALSCLAGLTLVGHGDSSQERYASSLQEKGRADDDHIYDEISVGICKGTAVAQVPILKAKTDQSSDNTSDVAAKERADTVDVINYSGDKASLKPPLLPKPRMAPKIQASAPMPGISSTKPLILKFSNIDPSTARNFKEPAAETGKEKPPFLISTAKNSHLQVASKRLPLPIKAPVARLEEFESFSDTVNSEKPVRPPRSPKHQPFKDEPFIVCDEKPQIPPKMKQWNCVTSGTVLASRNNFEALQIHCKTTKAKSASLERSTAFRYFKSEAKKSASLGRHSFTDHASYLENREGKSSLGTKGAPIPPPRQKKKQCGHSDSIPLYAQVNYGMKRNRRQAGAEQSECVTNVNEVPEHVVVIKGKLVLPRIKGDSLTNKTDNIMKGEYEEVGEPSLRNDVFQNNIKSMKQRNEMDVMREASICGKDSDVVSEWVVLNSVGGCVISEDKPLHTTDIDFISVDKNISHQTCLVDNRTSETNVTLSPVVESDVSSHYEETSTSDLLPEETKAVSDSDKPLITGSLPAPAITRDSDSYVECVPPEVQKDWTPDNRNSQLTELFTAGRAEYHAIEGNSFPDYHIVHSGSENVCENEVAVGINSNCTDSVNSDTVISVNSAVDETVASCYDLVIVHNTELGSTLEPDVCQNPDSANREYGLLPVTRKLDVTELGMLHQQKLPWHNCKNDSPSHEVSHRAPNTPKHKPKAYSWWCDEGELSSGALGDLDSSDNTARQSSFEDVESTCSESSSAGQSKLSTWFSSLGRGNWKYKARKDSNSQFYCDSQETCNHSSREEEPVKEQILDIEVTEDSAAEVPEIEVDVFSATVAEGSRPSSGLSTLSALDISPINDTPVLPEESFEMYQHSESDCEAEVNPEDRDATPSQLEVHHNKKAFYIAKELMTSERVFIDALKLLTVDFRQSVHTAAAEHRCAVISDAELDKILNSLPQLQSLNEDLLHDLEARIDKWSSIKKIADVIVRKGPFLKLYTSYIQNFESQCIYLEECCQKYPKFGKVVKEFEGSSRCQKLSLKHYMLKPVQRIPQYRLLLEDYLRHLSPVSPDWDDTHTALKIVRDVADHANRSIQLGDHFRRLLQLQSQLGNYEIIKPGRVFIKDGELFKLSRKGMQPRYFILLNDCLLYTSYYGSVQSSGLKVNYELPLSSIKVSIPRAEDYHNEFSVISVKRSFTISARSSIERQEWVDAIQKAITDCTSRQLSFQNTKIPSSIKNEVSSEPFKLGKEAPVWIQDRRVTMCQFCTTEFTVTLRRHHCRACGKVVCNDCSDFRAPLQYMRFQSARVCGECYNTLFTEAKDPTSEVNQEMNKELGKPVRIKDIFKRLGPSNGKKVKKYIPQRLKEVTANDTGSQMSGWLQRRSRRSWKRLWFVLKEQVLYVYKASEDVVALESIPVLGYAVETMKERHFQLYEGIDAKLVFQLAHRGQHPLIFHADNEHLANRWIEAMNEATILK